MKRQSGFSKIFAFTFARQTRSKGYIAGTIAAALICFLAPLLIMAAVEFFGGTSSQEDTVVTGISNVKTILTVDETEGETADFSTLSQSMPELAGISFISCEDYTSAAALAAQEPNSLIAVISEGENGYNLDIVLPTGTALTQDEASAAGGYLNTGFRQIQLQKSGVSQEAAAALLTPVSRQSMTAGEENLNDTESMLETVREILAYLLPVVNIMVLYFLILLYGQSVAGNVIMEKTSKLMDTFLVAVKPTAMVFGKVTAVALASILQFAIVICALIGGFAAGGIAVRAINPDSQMGILMFFDSLSMFDGMFTIPGTVLALLLVFGGFFLYCSLAAIGGSVAGKPEDLSSTNMIFALVLVVSFLAALYAGGLGLGGGPGNGQTYAVWLDYVPFTAVLVTPSRVLLGEVSFGMGLVSLVLVLAVSGICLALAGKIYRMMALYRGNPPTPAKLFQMLKSSKD